MQLEDFVNNIKSKEDFLAFLRLLVINNDTNKYEWENKDLESFLNGMIGFVFDIEGFLKTDVQDLKPTWKLFAEILLAAKVYE